MTAKKALDLYNQATESDFTEHDMLTKPQVKASIEAILKVSEMVFNMGGELQSRQIIATVIHFTHLQFVP